jgi:pyruvate/2-oxoglutarate dehydrogenase complex dihydrolipoamide dehydrogenase (E3) component
VVPTAEHYDVVVIGGGRPNTEASVEIRRHSQVVQQVQSQQQ